MNFNTIENQVSLEGLMTVSMLKNGLHVADFMCCEDVQAETFCAKCKVQMMTDGNMYITELPKRVKNTAIFRDDNCSLTLGRDGRWYFHFSLSNDQVEQLPEKLVRQASSIAQKLMRELNTERGSRR